MSYEDVLKLKEATGDNAITLAVKGHVSTNDGEVYVVNNKHNVLQWPQ